MSWNMGLTAGQQAAAGAPPGNLVLLAGPGTGKTFVLVRRIQYLVEEAQTPSRKILALAFTRAAAAEMRERLEAVPAASKVRPSTLHSFALRELLREGAADLPTPVRIVDDWEERNVVVEELARFLGRTVRDISNQRGTGALDRLADDWDTLSADGAGWEEGFPDPKFLSAWRQHREVYGYTLRSELVYQLLTELRSNPAFTPAEADAVLVDEYQDLNQCELTTIRYLAQRADAEVFAAGDDDQSIYLFRHAHPAGIRNFGNDYPGAQKLILTECLRCGPAIVALANWLIQQEHQREPKTLISTTEWPATVHLVRFPHQDAEAVGVAEMIDEEIRRGTRPEDILVLIKADTRGRISTAISDHLRQLHHATYRPRSVDTADQHLQLLLEYLTLAQSLDSEFGLDELSLRALLELEENGIGSDRLWRATKLALDRRIRFSAALEYASEHAEEFPRGQFKALLTQRDRILERARGIEQLDEETFDEWVTRVCAALQLPDETVELVDSATHDVEQELVEDPQTEPGAPEVTGPATGEGMATPSKTFIEQLRQALTHISDTLPAHLPGNVTITTMHGAKGLSADIVFVLQAEDEVIPGDAEGQHFDEARRLLYVSLTRARKKLIISACNRRTGPQRFVGRTESVQRTFTRFLRDYPLVGQTVEDYVTALGPASPPEA